MAGTTNANGSVGYYCEALYEDFPAVSSTAGQAPNVYATAELTTGPSPTPWAITACIGGGAKPAGKLGMLNRRSAWAASTAYAQWDTFTDGGATYMVVTAYTSGSAFGATDVTNTCVVLGSGTGSAATTTYSVTLPTGTSLSALTVNLTTNAPTGDYAGMTLIYSQTYVQ